MLMVLSLGACRRDVPVIDTAPAPAQPNGTISGTVRGPAGRASSEGRTVEVIDAATGERQQQMTSSTGGFTFRLKPGKYRVQVSLRDGESVVTQPVEIDLNRSVVDAHADFVVGATRTSQPRYPSTLPSSILGSPIA